MVKKKTEDTTNTVNELTPQDLYNRAVQAVKKFQDKGTPEEYNEALEAVDALNSACTKQCCIENEHGLPQKD